MKNRLFLTFAALLALSPFGRGENEIGYIEKFALAKDREKVLGELVPGSEDYYFFHALHYQNTRNEAKLAEILKLWGERFPDENARRRIILNREALLDYDATPQQTLVYLRERLGVHFNHQQEVRDQKPNLPTKLEAALTFGVKSELYDSAKKLTTGYCVFVAPWKLAGTFAIPAKLNKERPNGGVGGVFTD